MASRVIDSVDATGHKHPPRFSREGVPAAATGRPGRSRDTDVSVIRSTERSFTRPLGGVRFYSMQARDLRKSDDEVSRTTANGRSEPTDK